MSVGQQTRTRSERVASLRLAPGSWKRTIITLRRGDVLLRLTACLLCTVVLWSLTRGWYPQLGYRQGDTPSRDLVGRVPFKMPDEARTNDNRRRARQSVEGIYQHDPQPLEELRQELKVRVFQLLDASDFDDVATVWQEFHLPEADSTREEDQRTDFETFVGYFSDDQQLDRFDNSIANALATFERYGLLKELQHLKEEQFRDLRKTEIRVYRGSNPQRSTGVAVPDVLIPEAPVKTGLQHRLHAELSAPMLADRVFQWLYSHLPSTLSFDSQATTSAGQEAADRVLPDYRSYGADDVIAPRGRPLHDETMVLLQMEHAAYIATLGPGWRITFAVARWGMFASLFLVCGTYVYFRGPPEILELSNLVRLLVLLSVTVGVAWISASPGSQAELIPLMLFAMTLVIVYQQEVALLLSASLALAITLSLGQGLPEYVTVLTTLATALLLLRRIRTRTRLLYVGLTAGVMAFMTTFGVQVATGSVSLNGLFEKACWQGSYAALAGLLMTGLLPFVEHLFDVQTDLSLLEMGDVSHPLLQELVRRAPGTYNHSINVASLAESAAEAIGANGLLVRVGAYYHDIGKMLKPGYFVENQQGMPNRHDALPPAMSTLVIIAHVKDGADLARSHHLPQVIIDFIQQHHGTTLVEYFYRQASKRTDDNPDASEVDESSFRYPGPKPQTREAAVLMLADAVESACRALTDPAPARIEGLVEDIAMKRLLDGQFDACRLTLRDLRTVQDSLTKSLSAVYHGRIKYTDQQTA